MITFFKRFRFSLYEPAHCMMLLYKVSRMQDYDRPYNHATTSYWIVPGTYVEGGR